VKGALSPLRAARGRALASVLAAGREGVALQALVLGPDSRRAVGQLIGEGRLLVCADRVVRRRAAPQRGQS
jgi:hypothetical protein